MSILDQWLDEFIPSPVDMTGTTSADNTMATNRVRGNYGNVNDDALFPIESRPMNDVIHSTHYGGGNTNKTSTNDSLDTLMDWLEDGTFDYVFPDRSTESQLLNSDLHSSSDTLLLPTEDKFSDEDRAFMEDLIDVDWSAPPTPSMVEMKKKAKKPSTKKTSSRGGVPDHGVAPVYFNRGGNSKSVTAAAAVTTAKATTTTSYYSRPTRASSMSGSSTRSSSSTKKGSAGVSDEMKAKVTAAHDKYLLIKDNMTVDSVSKKAAFRQWRHLNFKVYKKPNLQFGKKVTVKPLSKYASNRIRIGGRFVKTVKKD